jgi:hypothetical protein
VVRSDEERKKILEACHRGLGSTSESQSLGGHLGRDKTLDKITARFYWRGVDGDVRRLVASCERCQKASTTFKKVDPELHSVPIEPKPMHQIGEY